MDIKNRDHILSAIKWLSLRKVTPTRAAILYTEFVTKWDKGEQLLDPVLDELLATGLIVQADGAYALASEGRRIAQQNAAREFGAWMIACENSAAYREMCRQLYGSARCQFNMTTQSQLEKAFDVLDISKRQRILDVGCGTGALTEYVADHTDGNVTGIDFSAEAIKFAQDKNKENPRLSFQVMDMDEFAFPPNSFDTILSVDTFYFLEDLPKTINAIRRSLQANGQMGIFYSPKVSPKESKEMLEPKNTALAQALETCGLTFETWDFTADEEQMWKKSMEIAIELKGRFADEGNLAIYEDRIDEATRELEFFNTKRKRRYLFHAWL